MSIKTDKYRNPIKHNVSKRNPITYTIGLIEIVDNNGIAKSLLEWLHISGPFGLHQNNIDPT